MDSSQSSTLVAEEDLHHQELVGTVCKGRLGHGDYGDSWWSTADNISRRYMIVQQIRKEAEHGRFVRAVGRESQSSWTRWEAALQCLLTWKDLWTTDQASYSVLCQTCCQHLLTCEYGKKKKRLHALCVNSLPCSVHYCVLR